MKVNMYDGVRRALLGLASTCMVAVTLTAQAQPVGTNQIALTDWDSTNPGWSYGYFYQWNDGGARGTYTENRAFTDPIIVPANGPLVFQYTFDGTAYADAIANNGGGFGTGFGTGMVWD